MQVASKLMAEMECRVSVVEVVVVGRQEPPGDPSICYGPSLHQLLGLVLLASSILPDSSGHRRRIPRVKGSRSCPRESQAAFLILGGARTPWRQQAFPAGHFLSDKCLHVFVFCTRSLGG